MTERAAGRAGRPLGAAAPADYSQVPVKLGTSV
jgi:hypothetical protein